MIRFLSNNLIESATLTASTENAQYPVTNIQEYFRTKVFRSTTNSDNIVIDLGSAQAVDYLGVVDNWQSGFGFTSITIEANATDSWGSPSYTTTLTFDSTYGVGVKSITEQSYRYWRIVLTSTLGYCELSNFFLGQAVNISTNGIEYGINYSNDDLKKVSTTRYGQEFIDSYGKRKRLSNISINVLNTTELDQFFEVYDDRGTTKPMFLDFYDDSNIFSNNSNRFSGYYKFTNTPSLTNTSSGFWKTSFSVIEQK